MNEEVGTMSESKATILGIVFAIIGIVLIFVGFKVSKSAINFMNVAQPMIATVEEVERVSMEKDGTSTYRIILSYEVEGENYTKEYETQRYEKKGTKVNAFYNPEKPNDLRLEKFSPQFVVLFMVGGLFFVVGLGYPISRLLNKNKSQII